jgi:hypothetical protein
MNDGRPRSRRWHRGPKGADLLDLVFKITSEPRWTATLRKNPNVVLVAKDGDELARLTLELALAILQHRYPETLSAMRATGSALPDPDPRALRGRQGACPSAAAASRAPPPAGSRQAQDGMREPA